MADSEIRTTTDHDTIRQWVIERQGHPAHVRGSRFRDEPGTLAIDFNIRETSFETISWDVFFRSFDARNLAFRYQNETPEGEISRFYEFVDRGQE